MKIDLQIVLEKFFFTVPMHLKKKKVRNDSGCLSSTMHIIDYTLLFDLKNKSMDF